MCQKTLMKKIKLPKNITISYQNQTLILSAIHGTTYLPIQSNIQITNDTDYIYLTLTNEKTAHKKYLGLYNSLIKTHLKGITQKFKLHLILKGIGFKVQKLETTLIFKLGYSHEIQMDVPTDISVLVLTNNQLILYGFNWEQLTQFASNIKKLKLVEPYKGKGILLKNEKILRKEGKKNKK